MLFDLVRFHYCQRIMTLKLYVSIVLHTIVLCTSIAAIDIDRDYADVISEFYCPKTTVNRTASNLPTPPKKFFTFISGALECNDSSADECKNGGKMWQTVEMVDVGDTRGRKGLRKVMPQGNNIHLVFEQDKNVRVSQNGNNSCEEVAWKDCTLDKLQNPMDIPAGMFAATAGAASVTDTLSFLNAIINAKDTWQVYNVTDGTVPFHVHGIAADHYIVCPKDAKANVLYEVELCYASNAKDLIDENAKNLPLRIIIKIGENSQPYGVNRTHVYEYSVNTQTVWTSAQEETYLMPPVGVYCPNHALQRDMPSLASSFKISTEYSAPRTIDYSSLIYDGGANLLGFTYMQDLPDQQFSQNTGITPAGGYFILQDFNTGLQYTLNHTSKACMSVNPLPVAAGSAVNKNGVLAMREPSLMLFGVPGANFSFAGQRLFMDILADVWQFQSDDDCVYDAYFTLKDWQVDNGLGQFATQVPFALVKYHSTSPGNSTTQHFHNFVQYGSQTKYPLFEFFENQAYHLDACFGAAVNASFLTVNLTGAKMDDFKTIGVNLVFNVIREKLAAKMNISVLRIGNMFLDELGSKTALVLFFTVLERPTPKGTPTERFFNDNVTTAAAVKNLNDSLNAAPLSIDGLPTAKDLKIDKGTLITVDRYYVGGGGSSQPKPASVVQGYSGGSMAAIAIIMLVLGAAAGVGFAWYRWKRGHGIAYQVYE